MTVFTISWSCYFQWRPSMIIPCLMRTMRIITLNSHHHVMMSMKHHVLIMTQIDYHVRPWLSPRKCTICTNWFDGVIRCPPQVSQILRDLPKVFWPHVSTVPAHSGEPLLSFTSLLLIYFELLALRTEKKPDANKRRATKNNPVSSDISRLVQSTKVWAYSVE